MTDTYTVAAKELPALQSMLAFQTQLAAGAVTTADDLCTKVSPLVDDYATVKNGTIKAWYDQLMGRLHSTTTIGGFSFPVLHMLWHYEQFCFRSVVTMYKFNSTDADWTSWWSSFINGKRVLYDSVGGIPSGTVPTIPDPYPLLDGFYFPAITSWLADDNAALKTWGDTPPSTLVAPDVALSTIRVGYPTGNGGVNYLDDHLAEGMPLYRQERDIINGWGAAAMTGQALFDALVKSEGTCYVDLLKPSVLDGQGYLFGLHLLVGLLTGKSVETLSARDLLTSDCSTDEYPNDTFANMLVYSALLTLADPLGSWRYSDTKMQAFLDELKGLVTGADPGSTALRNAVERHQQILVGQPAYPVTDPYAPSYSLPQRITDILAGLDEARTSLPPPDDE